MAALPSVFQAADHEKMSGSFEPIPAGWYIGQITKSEIKENSKKTGSFLSLEFTIVEGEYAKRKVFANLNLVNPSQVAVEIAQKELATICEACGIDAIEDSDELHGIPIGIKLKIKVASGDWPARNEITNYCQESEVPDNSSSPFN